MQNIEDCNWIAGIFEGEGSAGLRWAKLRHEGSAKRTYLYVSISQRETTMLEEVKRIAGCGKIYNANRKDGKSLFSWYCAARQARNFLQALFPYIRSEHKKKQVFEALQLDKEMRVIGGLARRAALTKARTIRWEKYRAKVS